MILFWFRIRLSVYLKESPDFVGVVLPSVISSTGSFFLRNSFDWRGIRLIITSPSSLCRNDPHHSSHTFLSASILKYNTSLVIFTFSNEMFEICLTMFSIVVLSCSEMSRPWNLTRKEGRVRNDWPGKLLACTNFAVKLRTLKCRHFLIDIQFGVRHYLVIYSFGKE